MSKKPHVVSGDAIDVSWDGRLCIHVEECVRARGDIFEAGRKPWAKLDTAPTDEVAGICERCPTGSMSYARKDGGAAEEAPARNTVVVSNDGPLFLHGDLQVAGRQDDMEGVRFRAALCRCGQSGNKPFCDGSHSKEGFKDSGAVGNPNPNSTESGGPLMVNRAKNGPLLLSGNFDIVTGSGRVAWSGQKAALCRCGLSKNKPFCDGSHKQSEFQAE
ncbi:MAG: CDGSH-type Zn-finger protein/uncharacterized Fe-S cluster protein YjdI [Rhodothermales bacterium]|jgi:CDGSH-type Zn-finger protein/uncharacterized Fe-S cluster protein YjdI